MGLTACYIRIKPLEPVENAVELKQVNCNFEGEKGITRNDKIRMLTPVYTNATIYRGRLSS